MKNPNSKGKLRAVLKAAILGAIIWEAVVWIGNLASIYEPGYLHGFLTDFFVSIFELLAIFFVIPVVWLASLASFNADGVFGYVVGGLIAAFIFAVIAACHQFIFKKDHEIKT
jgi:hypothetical protein